MSGASNPIDWLAKAKQDARSARRLMIAPPELEDAAYHPHQSVEKAMKALLVAEAIRFPRGSGGHDLDRLSMLIPLSHSLHAPARHLSALTPWATAFRYPSDDPFTAEPMPTSQEIERWLTEVEAFVEAVSLELAGPA